MKKYKFEFDYSFMDIVILAIKPVILAFVLTLIAGAIGRYYALFLLPILYGLVGLYLIILIIRYVLEGTTIVEVSGEKITQLNKELK